MEETKINDNKQIKSCIRSGLIRELHEQHILTDKQFEMLMNSIYKVT